MPRKPRRPCGQAGCPNLTDGYYCEKHKKEADAGYNRYKRDEESKGFYNSSAWRNLAKLQLQRQPLCEDCLKNGRVRKASIADHIIPIRQDPTRKLDRNNLQSLCHSCHNKKTAGEGKP